MSRNHGAVVLVLAIEGGGVGLLMVCGGGVHDGDRGLRRQEKMVAKLVVSFFGEYEFIKDKNEEKIRLAPNEPKAHCVC